jgi:hypothetical protein
MTRRNRVRPVRHVLVLAALLAAALSGIAQAVGQDAYPSPPPQDYDLPSAASDWTDQIPAHVYVVDGAAQLERDGQIDPLDENEPLLAGDRLRTARGRIEVLFSDGSSLALDEYSEVDLLSDALLRLNGGRIRLSIARGGSDLAYRVDATGATAWIRAAGEYDIAIDPGPADPDVRLTVLRGVAELSSPFGRTLVRSGLEARTSARTQPSLPYAVNVSAYDTFGRWVEDQYRDRVGSRSAQYLPAELRHYGGRFDRDGAWQYEGGYGYVWYPVVAADWRPYYHGGWSFVGSFGWTWVGAGRWTWPTHHYGRWGFRTGRWFWIPGRRWAPAWVSWGSAPGYVSWCPLGFDGRPVFALTTINVYRNSPRHGWTILPTSAFRSRVAVSRYAVHSLPDGMGSRFVGHQGAPVRPVLRATRAVEPLRAPTYASTRYAVPRSASTAGPVLRSGAGTASAPGARSRARVGASPGGVGAADRAAPQAERAGQSPVIRSTQPRSATEAPAPDAPARRAAPRGPRSAPAPASPPGRVAPNGPANRGSESAPEAPSSRRAVGRRSAITPLPDASAPARRTAPARSASSVQTRGNAPIVNSAPRIQRASPVGPRTDRPASAPMLRADRPVSRPVPAPRVQRSAPAASPRSQRASPGGRIDRAPSQAPRVERSTPARSVQSSPRSRAAGASSGGQARSRSR